MRRLVPVCLVALATAPAIAAEPVFTKVAVDTAALGESGSWTDGQSALVVKVQVLLDRAGWSPGVVDGFLGENVRKALAAFEEANGMEVDGDLDEAAFDKLQGDAGDAPILTRYTITADDLGGPYMETIPDDYAEMAELDGLPFHGPREMLAERFHMDIDLLGELNPDADFEAAGTEILVAQPGEPVVESPIARIEVDRTRGAVRALAEDGSLLLHYPASIGSTETPSPSGTHEITAIATDPVYYYRPDVNFRQGDNEEQLAIPPGPNNPVGTVWIDLSEPTYGIHGTPDPAEVDKVYSHGCVRLTNWDVEELAGLVETGLTVTFVE